MDMSEAMYELRLLAGNGFTQELTAYEKTRLVERTKGMDIQTKTDIIHQKIYDFLLYIYPLLTKYPKYEKFSLQTATRNAILEMLQEVIKWDKTATKSHLYTVDTALQESKELLRLAHDLKYSAMNARHYGESCRKLKEIGVMLGELIEEVKTRK